MEIKDLRKSPLVYDINQRLIPVTAIDFSTENINFYNSIVDFCKENNYNTIIRTPRGNIAYSKTICPAYDVRSTKSLVEITVIDINGCFRLQVRTVNTSVKEKDENLNGFTAFMEFKRLCKKISNIDIDTYAENDIEKAAHEKVNIEKYMISLNNDVQIGRTYFNAHHVDFHSAFPSGLIATHPEFKDIIEYLYNNRKVNADLKYVLNATIGYMQSSICRYKFVKLAKDAINESNRRLRELAKKIENSGRKILSFNTDGIWYTGPEYYDENEGPNLLQYDNDYTNCMIRFKSKGAYEFITRDGSYHPVIRGRTLLDDIKDRSEWEWGDIFSNQAEVYKVILEEDQKLRILGETHG